jgi:hypothetical protein
MIIIHKHGRSQSLPRQDLPHNSNSSLKTFNLSHAYLFASVGGFLWFSKTKFLQQVLDKKTFSKLYQVAQVAILNKFYKTLTSHKSLI